MALQLARAPRNHIGQHGRQRGIKHPLAALEPGAGQRPEAGCGKRPSGPPIADIPRERGGSPRVKEPAQLVERRGSQRHREVLEKRALVPTGGVRQVSRHEKAKRPRRQGAEEFGMPLEERPEVNRDRRHAGVIATELLVATASGARHGVQ